MYVAADFRLTLAAEVGVDRVSASLFAIQTAWVGHRDFGDEALLVKSDIGSNT